MSYPFLRPRCGAALLLAAATAAGCATTKPTASPEEEYRQAVEEAQKGHYVEAQRLFESVRDADTPVRLELLAEVGVADALYKGGKFEEAAEAYAKLLEVHSGDAIADYLNYQLGMCFYRRIDTVDRDQGLTRKARTQFMALITRYPESDLAEAAREKLQACNDYLARRELYVGRFYLERANYEAAKRRFLRGLGRYGKVEVEPELLHDLCLAEDGLGETRLADQAAKRLRHEFPAAAATAALAADRAEVRARREGDTGDGPLHRIGRWWRDRHSDAEGEATEGVATGAMPPKGAAPAAPETPAAAETAPAPATTPLPTTTGDGAAAAEPSHPTRVFALNPEAPWPGATVATDPSRTPTPLEEVAQPPDTPSRWRHLLSWLHRNGEAPTKTTTTPKATPESTPTPGLIVRHIPPVEHEAPIAPATAATPPSPSSVSRLAPAKAPTMETTPPADAIAAKIPAVAESVTPPLAAPSPEPPAATPTPPPTALSATPSTALTRTLTAQRNGGDLVVEEFPAVEADAAPTRPAPPTDPRMSLADRVDETLGREPAVPPAATPAADQPVEATRLPAAAPPTPQPLVASGKALRHDRPRPLPRPTFTRPSPPLPDESLPAMIDGGDEAVEWHTMTPPPVAPVAESGLATASSAPTATSEPPPTTEAQRHGAFWSGVRERFTSTADE